MAAAPQLLLVVFPAVLTLLLASAPGARARASSSSSSSAMFRCGWCPRRSTASLLPPEAGVITGASCGYGGPAAEMAVDGGFHIAAVSAGFFSKGRACGACYQLRCRDQSACAKDGVKVVVLGQVTATNRTAGGRGRFMLTKDAFAAMTTTARGGLAASVVVDVDFRRIPCAYKEKKLAVKVEETSSRHSGHLALRFLYQGGQTDIVAVEVAQAVNDTASRANNEASPSQTSWQYMTRREGSPAVWRTSRVPAGPLLLRLVVTAGSGGKWMRADGAVLPAEWQTGAVYDTGLRVTDVAANTCGGASCNAMDKGHDHEQLR